MNHTKARKAIHAVALQSGVSVDAVMKEMEEAIEKGRRCTTPQARKFWSDVPCRGGGPTPVEVIAYLAGLAKKR